MKEKADGSFEAPVVPPGQESLGLTGVDALPGWRLLRGSVDVVPGMPMGWQPAPDGGSQSLDLVGGPEASSIEQSLPTEPGRTYLFSGWTSRVPGTKEGGASVAVDGQVYANLDHSQMYFGPVTREDPPASRVPGWLSLALTFRATGATTTITFAAAAGFPGFVLDGLAVTPAAPGP